MQEQSCSILSFNHVEEDSQLGLFFSFMDQHQRSNTEGKSKELVEENYDHIMITEGQLYKDYESDLSPDKKGKNKRVKKKKNVGIFKTDQNKVRINKFYVESLQNRINDLEQEVERLKNLNKLNIEYIRKINDSQLIVINEVTQINGFFQHRQKIVQKLQKLTNCQNPDLRRIKMQCISLKHKQGAFGQDRIKAVKYCFKQLIEMMPSNINKYFAQVAFRNTDLFNPSSIDTWEEWRKQLFLKLDLSQETLDLFSRRRPKIIEAQSKFNKKLLELYESKCEILKISRQIEKVYEEFNQNLTPLQVGRFLCFLEKYKFQSNFYSQDSVRQMYQQLQNENNFSYDAENSQQS